jgi:hypothetical protein
MRRGILVGLVWVLLLLPACNTSATTGNPTLGQLPSLSAYNQYEGQKLWEQGSDAAMVALLFAGQPQMEPLAATIRTLGGCAQQQGVANWRAYVAKDDVTAAGVVLIASQKQMTNPMVVFQCGVSKMTGKNASEISFCSRQYNYTTSDDTYYVVYAGSQERVCTDLCNALQDCAG